MRIVVAVRCRNEIKHIDRFLDRYGFADYIVASDGGSTDGSWERLYREDKVCLFSFKETEVIGGETWNPDAPHMNFVIDKAKELDPDWLIFDDMDCAPDQSLWSQARRLLRECDQPQVNVFRLYMWGDDQYFPFMNRHFDPAYTSLWAWRPRQVNIRADPAFHHGTIVGQSDAICHLDIPYCLLHKSWSPDTIDAKVKRQNAVGIQMGHPFTFAGTPEPLPEWAIE